MKDILFVCIQRYPFEEYNARPICEARQKEINVSEDISFSGEKYFTWRLLEDMFLDFLKIDINSLNPRKLETGKWVVDEYYISLSNSGKYVMAAISTKSVGVDVQKLREVYKEHFIEIEMCEEEIEYYTGKEDWEYFFEHVEKEAIYKCFGTGALEWKKINTLNYQDKLITSEFGEYVYSICSDLITENIDLELFINGERIEFE